MHMKAKAAVTDLIILVLWILPEGLYPLLGQTTIFDPYQHFSRPQAARPRR